jgi:hypothetical protein
VDSGIRGEIMSYLKITVKTNEELAKKILEKWQFALYKVKLRGLYNMLRFRLSKYITEEGKDYFIAREESDNEYIAKELKEWENFMFAGDAELGKDKYKEFQQYRNDRWLMRVVNRAKVFKQNVRDKAIRTALMSDTVMSFFSRVGIIIEYESNLKNGKK